VADPILEARRADTRVTARGEALIVQLYAEVTCVDVCDHLTWVLVCAQELSDEFIETPRLRAGQLDGAVQRLVHRNDPLFIPAGA
jgi:hypothetical protein